MTDATNYHHVRVTTIPAEDPEDSPTVDRVAFTCTAPESAWCRTYPDRDVCDCESWSGDDPDESGHSFKAGQPCWLISWFENEGACFDDVDCFNDGGYPPAIDREGPVECSFEGDFVSWAWVEAN